MWLTAKCIMHMDFEDPVGVCYEWQRACMNIECWPNALKETKRGRPCMRLAESAGK